MLCVIVLIVLAPSKSTFQLKFFWTDKLKNGRKSETESTKWRRDTNHNDKDFNNIMSFT